MSVHHPSLDQNQFLLYANRVLSITLQSGNANVSSRGIMEMLHYGFRAGPRIGIENSIISA
jgi:hypothetical protein